MGLHGRNYRFNERYKQITYTRIEVEKKRGKRNKEYENSTPNLLINHTQQSQNPHNQPRNSSHRLDEAIEISRDQHVGFDLLVLSHGVHYLVGNQAIPFPIQLLLDCGGFKQELKLLLHQQRNLTSLLHIKSKDHDFVS